MNASEIATLVQGMLAQNNETLLAPIDSRFQQMQVNQNSISQPAPQVRISEDDSMNEYEGEEQEQEEGEENKIFASGSEAWAEVLPSGKRTAYGRGMQLVGRIAFPPLVL